ncbi:MAG: magnesium/cobalt transporter CorA [Patescibacteria group bacterium]|jgi:magnesium transporter
MTGQILDKRTRKVGLDPGSLVYVGKERQTKPIITVMDFDEKKLIEKEVTDIKECFEFRKKPTVTWINIEGLNDIAILKELGDHYGFHPLLLEDILNTHQRPKTEDFGDYIYVVLKIFHLRKDIFRADTEQISLILGSNYVISLQEGFKSDVFDSLRERIRKESSRVRRMGPDYLMHNMIDTIVDNYFVILERLGEKIEDLEDEMVTQPAASTLRNLHRLKREIIFIRKSVWPMREVVNNMVRGESSNLIKKNTYLYLRDVYDHTIQIIDNIETYRDILAAMLDIYLSSINNRLNTIMKVLTIITTIFMPLTFLTGLYGMNFKYLPMAEWHDGFYIILAFSLTISGTMLIYFRQKDWL